MLFRSACIKPPLCPEITSVFYSSLVVQLPELGGKNPTAEDGHGGLEALFLHAVAEGVHQLHGDVAAHVGEDELFFQLIVSLTEQAGKQRYKDSADKGNAAARHELLNAL